MIVAKDTVQLSKDELASLLTAEVLSATEVFTMISAGENQKARLKENFLRLIEDQNYLEAKIECINSPRQNEAN